MKSGWATKKLGEVCEKIVDGDHNPPKGVDHSNYLMLSSKNIQNGAITFDAPRFLSESDFEIVSRRTNVSRGDVLLTIVGTIGRSCVFESDAHIALQRSVAVLKPILSIVGSRYLMYLLQSMAQELESKGHGAAQKGLYLKKLADIPIPIPPLAEQMRIVAKIDAAFEKIDALKANAEKNLANAKELFQSALDEAMRPKPGWVEKRLGEVAEIQRGGSPRPIKDFITQSRDGYNWIKIGDVDPSGKFITSTAEKIRKEGLRKTRQVFAGEFLLSNSMSFGRPYILKIDGCIHDGWLVLRGFQKFYKEDFFYHLLRSRWIQDQFNSLAYGSTVRNLNSNSVSKVIVPIVALEEQQEIADSLDRLQSQVGVLQQNYAQQIADCAEMRQAILREAFEGRL